MATPLDRLVESSNTRLAEQLAKDMHAIETGNATWDSLPAEARAARVQAAKRLMEHYVVIRKREKEAEER